MAAFVYNTAARDMWSDVVDLLNDTIKVGLSSSTHVPNRDNEFLDEAGADDFVDGELSGTGYTGGFGGSGRKILASKTIVVDLVNDRAEFDAADLTGASGWQGINAGTAAQATVLKELTTDADSKTIANIDSGGFPITTNGGDLGISWNAEGVIQLSTV